MSGLNELSKKIHRTAIAKGWWEDLDDDRMNIDQAVERRRRFGEILVLIHSEVSEALEEYRNGHGVSEVYFPDAGVIEDASGFPADAMNWAEHYGWKPEGIPIEFADIIIRVLDAVGAYGIDIEQAIALKMAYNEGRPHRHGGKLI